MSDPRTLPPNFFPSDASPAELALVASVIRKILAALAGAGLYSGVMSDSQAMLWASALAGVASLAWGIWQKYSAAKSAHKAAVASAQLGVATKVSP